MGVQETTTAADDGETASVTINEQETEGAQVVIESVTMPEGGFIAIHDSSVADAPIASVLGNSVYLEAGTHENVTVTLARPITESQTLVAMPHLDTNDNEVYDFVLSTGELDGPYTANESIVIDQANVTLAQETATTTEAPEETTTTEEVEDTTTEAIEETTTTEAVEETTTTEEVEGTTTTEEVEGTTTTEEVEETTTTEAVEETTTEEATEDTTTEEVEDTTTEEVVDETTTEAAEEPPAEMEQFVFKVEQMSIDEWSFVVGDEETPDRTETLSNVNIEDRRVTINLTEVLQQSAASQDQMGEITTQSQEQIEEQLEENLSQDIETVRFVIRNVNVENVTFVITAPEDVELPQPPMTTTTEAPEETTTTEEVEETTTEEVVEETTTEEVEETTTEEIEETTTTEEVVEETTTEEVEETTTTEEVEETTTTEAVEETTTTEEVEETTTTEAVEETTTTEAVEETTTEEVEETTTTEADEETTTAEVEETTTTEAVEETTTTEETIGTEDLDSFEVSELDAPESASASDTVTVTASVSNPNDQQVTQMVAFRLEGTVIDRESVTLDAGEQTTVRFEVNTEGVSAGQYIHGVYTRDFGELAVIVIEEPGAETTTAVGNETTTAEA